MYARDETLLFSITAILLAALTLAGLAEFASADAQAFTKERELLLSRSVANRGESRLSRGSTCASAAAAPAAQHGAERQG